MEWRFADGAPIYQQIVMTIRIGIANGTYPPGGKMPAVRELALEAGVNPNTMQRALSELERDGLLYTARTSGRFVTEDREHLDRLREELGETFIGEMFDKLYQLGMSGEQIVAAVQKWEKERHGG